jgi:hypothetical protein
MPGRTTVALRTEYHGAKCQIGDKKAAIAELLWFMAIS